MSERERKTLQEITDLVTDGKHGDCENEVDSGYFFLSVKDIKDNRLNYSQARQITKIDFEDTDRRTNLQPGDILFTNTGTIGRMAIAPDHELTRRTTFQKSVAILKPKREVVESRYLFYLLKAENGRLSAYAEGTTQKNLLLKDFRSFEVGDLPPLSEQSQITSVLGTLDDKIELNRRANETLEGVVKALFKSWFVDFEPVRAKAEGRPTGLPDEISELFPYSLEESELGEVPSGWSYEKASDLYQVTIGKTPPRKETWWFSESNRDIPWLSIKDMGSAFVYAMETSEYLTRDAVDTFNVRVVPRGTVLVSFKLTVGRVAIAPFEMLTNEAIAHFSPLLESIPPSYSYCLLSSYDYASLGSTSSIATAVNSKMLREMKLLNAPGDLRKAFDQMISPVFLKIQQVIAQTKLLEETRDALLPRLISGELRVPDAEKMLEEAGI